MLKIFKNLAIFSAIILAWSLFSSFINNLVIWRWLTQFFVLIRTLVKPVDFLWHFGTSFTIIGIVLSILIAYSGLQVFIVIRDNFKD